MWIIPKGDMSTGDVCWWLQQVISKSRFRAEISESQCRRVNRWGVKIEKIRLREKKDYCGMHPGPCPIDPFFPQKKHPISFKLEGADYVGWNDGLNDLCDARGWNADIFSYNREAGKWSDRKQRWVSSTYYIRKGLCRRVSYAKFTIYSGARVFRHWDCDGEFENFCGKGPQRSEYPDGTPGLACWTLEEAAALAHTLEHVHA